MVASQRVTRPNITPPNNLQFPLTTLRLTTPLIMIIAMLVARFWPGRGSLVVLAIRWGQSIAAGWTKYSVSVEIKGGEGGLEGWC